MFYTRTDMQVVTKRGYNYLRKPTAKAIANSMGIYGDHPLNINEYSNYWMSSPDASSDSCMLRILSPYEGGNSKTTLWITGCASYCGVLPAVYLKSDVSALSGDGSEKNPYIVAKKQDIKVKLDGDILSFDVSPKLICDRVLVPFRKILEALGAVVQWNESTSTVTGSKDNIAIKLTIGSSTVEVNGEAKLLDVAPVIIDGRMLVPARFISKAMGAAVDWDGLANTVIITTSINPENLKIQTGGVVCDYLRKTLWDKFWPESDRCLKILKNNGMNWVRVGVTTFSSDKLKNTPVKNWGSLEWESNFWFSQEFAEGIIKQAMDNNMKIDLFLFLSDSAAHAGIQNAPKDWENLSVEDTAKKLKDYCCKKPDIIWIRVIRLIYMILAMK